MPKGGGHSLVDHVELHGMGHDGGIREGVLAVHAHLAVLEHEQVEGLVEPHTAPVAVQQVGCPLRQRLEGKAVAVQDDLKPITT